MLGSPSHTLLERACPSIIPSRHQCTRCAVLTKPKMVLSASLPPAVLGAAAAATARLTPAARCSLREDAAPPDPDLTGAARGCCCCSIGRDAKPGERCCCWTGLGGTAASAVLPLLLAALLPVDASAAGVAAGRPALALGAAVAAATGATGAAAETGLAVTADDDDTAGLLTLSCAAGCADLLLLLGAGMLAAMLLRTLLLIAAGATAALLRERRAR